MRKLILLAVLCMPIACIAQTKGNKDIATRSYKVSSIKTIILDMYAELTIDCAADEKLTITTDENLLNLLNTKVENSTLRLSQIKWIEPSKRVKITIGAPYLKKLEVDTHETVVLSNISNDHLELVASIGTIKAIGTTKYLQIDSSNGNISASGLITEKASINIGGSGKVTVYATEELDAQIYGDGSLTLLHEPKLKQIKRTQLTEEKRFEPNENLKWINLKIKNNSWNRNKFVVIGPKKDGGHFSYGFAMFPGTTKTERWSIGTKVYKDRGAGVKEYLVTVQESNRNNTLKLFKD